MQSEILPGHSSRQSPHTEDHARRYSPRTGPEEGAPSPPFPSLADERDGNFDYVFQSEPIDDTLSSSCFCWNTNTLILLLG
ncbi:hypothetical protein J6590_069624 [Homalodisca vitripennis]|nr:hypothetical protein J6590_069624 [Homalodisca vitripennis]